MNPIDGRHRAIDIGAPGRIIPAPGGRRPAGPWRGPVLIPIQRPARGKPGAAHPIHVQRGQRGGTALHRQGQRLIGQAADKTTGQRNYAFVGEDLQRIDIQQHAELDLAVDRANGGRLPQSRELLGGGGIGNGVPRQGQVDRGGVARSELQFNVEQPPAQSPQQIGARIERLARPMVGAPAQAGHLADRQRIKLRPTGSAQQLEFLGN